jgi:chromosome segregation protein
MPGCVAARKPPAAQGETVYLKALEMVGFKSFAERTKLVFEPGMMAIVGPNGCGKSNVSDAIRWVLGNRARRRCAAAP